MALAVGEVDRQADLLDVYSIEFGRGGRLWNHASIATLLAGPPADVLLDAFAAALLAEEVALATHTVPSARRPVPPPTVLPYAARPTTIRRP